VLNEPVLPVDGFDSFHPEESLWAQGMYSSLYQLYTKDILVATASTNFGADSTYFFLFQTAKNNLQNISCFCTFKNESIPVGVGQLLPIRGRE
jgi:hypothetical protein